MSLFNESLYNVKIKAIQDTYLKKCDTFSVTNKKVPDASELPDDKKVKVKKDKEYSVKAYHRVDSNHDKVELDFGAGTWFIFDDHWDVDWERDDEKGAYNPIGIDQTIQTNRNDPTLWTNNSNLISKYFTVGEVTQYDARRIPPRGSQIETNIFLLADELDKLRHSWGVPISITSWYRPPSINRAVGGVRNSTHIQGYAADIFPSTTDPNKNLAQLERHCLLHWKGGVGKGSRKGFVHVDCRSGFPCYQAGQATVAWNY